MRMFNMWMYVTANTVLCDLYIMYLKKHDLSMEVLEFRKHEKHSSNFGKTMNWSKGLIELSNNLQKCASDYWAADKKCRCNDKNNSKGNQEYVWYLQLGMAKVNSFSNGHNTSEGGDEHVDEMNGRNQQK